MENMTEDQEAARDEENWIRGNNAAWLRIYQEAAREIGQDEAKVAANARELHDARANLRDVFEMLGIDWPGDDLNLADVIEKHLYRELQSRGLEHPEFPRP